MSNYISSGAKNGMRWVRKASQEIDPNSSIQIQTNK
jgi:hypothetical protein